MSSLGDEFVLVKKCTVIGSSSSSSSGGTLGSTKSSTAGCATVQPVSPATLSSSAKGDLKETLEDTTQAFTTLVVNRGNRGQVSGMVKTVLNADGFWTTSTSSAMSTNMTLLPAGDSMFATFCKLFDEVRFDKAIVTFDFTEYESLLERSVSSATARSFVLALTRLNSQTSDYYYLQDRPGSKMCSPSCSRRVFKLEMPLTGLITSSGGQYAAANGWYSTQTLASVSASEVIAGRALFASSDTCGVAGVVRVRVQFLTRFRGRRGGV